MFGHALIHFATCADITTLFAGSMETGDTDRVQAVHEKLQDPTTSIEFQAMKNETVPINRITAMTVQGINFSEHHLRVEDDIVSVLGCVTYCEVCWT